MSRTGKIARLPRVTRDELNRRLEDGAIGESLLDWLNALPETQAVLAERFAGVPISKQNLSEWRLGGFAEWQTRQDMVAGSQELSADAAEVKTAVKGSLSDDLSTVLAARYATALVGWNGEPSDEFRQKLKMLRGLCRDISIIRRGDNSTAKVRLVEAQAEAERKKTEEELVAQFEEWAKIPAVQDWLCQTWVPLKERMRRKREMFGLPPLPEDQPEPAMGDKRAPIPAPQSNLVKPNQTKTEPGTPGTPAGRSAEFIPPHQPNSSQRPEPPATGHILTHPHPDSAIDDGQSPVPTVQSNPVKPNQTNFASPDHESPLETIITATIDPHRSAAAPVAAD